MGKGQMLLQYVSAVLAFLVISVFCFIVVYSTVSGKGFVVPESFLVLVSVISGVLFGSHATANGTSATAAKLVDALQRSAPAALTDGGNP